MINKIILKSELKINLSIGINAHKVKEIIIAIAGEAPYKKLFPLESFSVCFRNSFTASLNGCKIPDNPALLGPRRSWDNPKIFRSIRVTKATFTSTGITKIKISRIKITL